MKTRTYCHICVCLCGLEVSSENNKIIRILPDKTNPFNWRDFCIKAGSANEVRDHPKRLLSPMKRIGDKYVEVSYEQAIREIAVQLSSIRKRYGANAIAAYLGNPGGMNTTNAFGHSGFMAAIGSKNNYNVASIDQANHHLVMKAMYGSDLAVLVPDMNPAISGMNWADTVADGWKRILAAQARGADVIIVDPRQTPSSKKANTHVIIRPGEDWAFLLGVIKVIFEQGWQHQQDCDQANGVDSLKSIAASASLEQLSARCNVSADMIRDVARRFATVETSVCVARTGVSQNRNGTLGEWLSHALNLICGRIDRKGGRYYQPGIFKNSMKVYNSIAPSVKRRSRIGNYQAVIGSYPLATLPDEITTPGTDQVRALIITGGNPVVSGPDGNKLDAAMQQLECLIAVDLFQRESHRHAHWLIPGTHFLEKEDFFGALMSMIYEKPFAQLGPAAVTPLNNIKHEWEFFIDLALAMKRPFMGIPGMNGVIRVSRWLARLTGNSHHAFNPRWFWALLIKLFGRVKWKDIVSNPQGFVFGEKEYNQFRSSLQTKDGRINAVPDEFVLALKQRLSEVNPHDNTDGRLLLVAQRRQTMMNSWLSGTIKHHRPYGDVVEINPLDAAKRNLQNEQAIKIISKTTALNGKLRITVDVPPGIVSIDHGWGSRLFDPRHGSEPEVAGINRNSLVASDVIDELSGLPNLNSTYVKLSAPT
jgi:formate dehydrogenase